MRLHGRDSKRSARSTEREEESSKTRSGRVRTISLGGRRHMGIGIALLTIVPCLVSYFLFLTNRLLGAGSLIQNALVIVLSVTVVVLGYLLLAKYPVNITRLRAYLEDMVVGRFPDKVTLLKGMDDISAIERALNLIVEQLSRQVYRIQGELREQKIIDQFKDEFVSTVSHELRTPLSVAKEGISLLLDGVPGRISEKQKNVLFIAKSNIDRLGRIINDLLDISKIEAGKFELRKKKINVSDLVKHVAVSMSPVVEQKGLNLKTSLPKSRLVVCADADRIIQVLMNLVGNAVKFTKEGHVRISARSTDGEVECAVEDTGMGIADDDFGRLFQKFVQIKKTGSGGQHGTGLGLVIAKNIVELHGGEISVQSQPDVGSRFVFTLPRHEGE